MKHEAKAPPGWGEKAMQHLKKEYKGDDDAAFGTAWTLHERGVSGGEYLGGKESTLDRAVKSAVDGMFGKKANNQVPHLVGAIKEQMNEMLAAAGGQRRLLEGPFSEMHGYLNAILEVERTEAETGVMAY